ncbi:MAG: cytochrome c oxidase subunit II [Rhodospirillales bacterium]
MKLLRALPVIGLVGFGCLLALPALADQPRPWEINFQDPATPVAERVHELHTLLLYIVTAITLFVVALLAYVIWRFHESRHPTPSRTTHNTLVEVLWTVLPVIILVVMAIPSFRLLYFQDRTPNPEMTIKAIGHQWNWSYVYPDNGNFTFDAFWVKDADLKPDQPRLLQTDAAIVVPVDTNIRLYTTSSDVIHSWTVPAFGIKIDAVTGRLNESWFRVTKAGTYYGQCSELCGEGHAFMPIMVRAVSKDEFDKWAAEARTKFDKADGSPPDQAPVQNADAGSAPVPGAGSPPRSVQ